MYRGWGVGGGGGTCSPLNPLPLDPLLKASVFKVSDTFSNRLLAYSTGGW